MQLQNYKKVKLSCKNVFVKASILTFFTQYFLSNLFSNFTVSACYTGCTGVLLSELANRSLPLPSIDTSGMEYPWDDLNHIQTQVKDLRVSERLV